MMMDFYERIREELESWGTDELVSIWNDYCNECNYMDDYIECNDPNEFMYGKTPSEVLEEIGNDYNIRDNYVVYTIHGWESFNYDSDKHCPINVDDLVNWIVDDEDGHGYHVLQDIVDEYLESLEEDEDDEPEEPYDIDSDMGYDPYMGMITDEV